VTFGPSALTQAVSAGKDSWRSTVEVPEWVAQRAARARPLDPSRHASLKRGPKGSVSAQCLPATIEGETMGSRLGRARAMTPQP
jgi:hypothetical protein